MPADDLARAAAVRADWPARELPFATGGSGRPEWGVGSHRALWRTQKHRAIQAIISKW